MIEAKHIKHATEILTKKEPQYHHAVFFPKETIICSHNKPKRCQLTYIQSMKHHTRIVTLACQTKRQPKTVPPIRNVIKLPKRTYELE